MKRNQHNYKSMALILFFTSIASLPSFAINPVYKADFNASSLEAAGWTAIPSGSGEFTPATALAGLIPMSPGNPGLTDGRGIQITAASGQGSLIFGPAIPVGNDPVILKLSVLAQSKGGSIAVGALDIPQGGSIADADGSAGYSIESDSARFMDDYQQVTVLYQPKGRAIIPIFQLAVNSSTDPTIVTALFDNFEVYPLTTETVADSELRRIFGIGGTVAPPAPTPTPTVTPTPQPTLPPASETDIALNDVFEISPTNDERDVAAPKLAYDRFDAYAMAAEDETSGFADIVMRNIDISPLRIEDGVTVNETFENTEAYEPDLDIDFSGTRHVVWSDNRDLTKLYSIYLAEYDSFGNRRGDSDIEVNSLFDNTNAANPVIDVRDDGRMAVAWTDNRNFFNDVFVRRLRWTGIRVETSDDNDFQVNIPFDDTQARNPDVAADGNGNIAVVWSDNRFIVGASKRFDIYARIFNFNTQVNSDRQLANSVVETQVNLLDGAGDEAGNPQIAHSNGRFMVVWENKEVSPDSYHINASVINAQGEVIQSEFFITDPRANSRYLAPSVAVYDKDIFLISWHDGGNDEILMRLYDAGKHLFLTDMVPMVADAEAVTRTSIAAGAPDFLTVWSGLTGRFLDAFGISGEIRLGSINAKTAHPVRPQSRSLSPNSILVPMSEQPRTERNAKQERESITSPRR